jgi:hypothetical protein
MALEDLEFKMPTSNAKQVSAYRLLTISIVWLLMASCTTVVLPLCPAIARISYSTNQEDAVINRLIIQEAKARQIKINQLSWFSAEFSGYSPSVAAFKKNYRYMLCAFDPSNPKILQAKVRDTYQSCMTHAEEWIESTASKPETLMTTNSVFYEDCAIRD